MDGWMDEMDGWMDETDGWFWLDTVRMYWELLICTLYSIFRGSGFFFNGYRRLATYVCIVLRR